MIRTDPALDFRSTNALWSSVAVETLVRSGIRHAVISPGSRSTPLTIAFARHPDVMAHPVLDERSAAFFALGLAKARQEPVVLLCTSGTAAANYFPAVIEAHESAVPLLVITADRPPEMRACASGQTIDQQKLFGSYVGFYHELAVPELDLGRLRYLRQTLRHAVDRTRAPQSAPVHLNAPFRDPLPPLPDGGTAERFAAAVDWNSFWTEVEPARRATAISVPTDLRPDVHGVIVVGPSQPADDAAFADAFGGIARRLGWPVLADGLSPVRNHATRIPNVVTTYDVILRDPMTAEQLKPDVVLAVGGWPTSKVLRSWLEKCDAVTWLVADRFDNRDALHGRVRQMTCGLAEVVAALPEGATSGGYPVLWTRQEERVRAALDARLEAEQQGVEPKAAWLLSRHLPAGTPLFIANSMPIRDVEYVWPANGRGIRPFCNRGANGIDGTLSTALGVAQGLDAPSVLLTGDLAFLHDINGLLLRPRLQTSVTIVLINNQGGGIFEHLPVAQFEPPFEAYFATPQQVDFASLCAAHGVEHRVVSGWPEFVQLVSSLPPAGLRVLELRTDRKRDAAFRKALFAELAAPAR